MIENNAVIGSILENLDEIEIVYKDTYEPFQNDRGNTGDSKEYSIQEFIAAYLTRDYQIKKGCIYNKTSNSQNIDCVILAPNHPALTTPKREVILAEGVYAAVEVKPDIRNKSEFERGLKQIKSIKKLERELNIVDLSKLTGKAPREEWQNKIPAILFSHTSLEPNDLYEFLKEKINEGLITTDELPDLILTLDHGLYAFAPNIRKKPFGNWFIDNSKGKFTDTTMIQFCETSKEETLALFILQLLSLPSPTILYDNSLIIKYLKDIKNIAVCGYEFGK